MADADRDPEKLWLETPLVHSPHISARLGCNAYLKLETLQPSQSFKYRGISYFIQDAVRKHGHGIHLIAASSGNAGLAVACVSKRLGVRCTVYLHEGVSTSTIEFLRREGAEVVSVGTCYLHARRKAEEAVKLNTNAVMVPPYDDPLVWAGHGSMIAEIARQLPAGTKPDAVFCSVGGGGLAGGIMYGCKSIGWDDVLLVALEPTGSNCFYQSLAANAGAWPVSSTLPEDTRVEHNGIHNVEVAHLSKLTSRATSLGASSPAAAVVKMALERSGGVESVCVPDEMIMQAALLFAEEHKMLAELACSATLTPAYKSDLFNKLLPRPSTATPRTAVFIVCGGFKISLEEMEEYKKLLEADAGRGGQWTVLCNGEQWNVEK
ncbi:tryptophan synthase beta subunit-like PLP-dependent enzyme [Laetiporus sulphureus 93-53]|uniref:L-serine ammonia-lyase n=1 Tax=Laetiporus sulphureus 93-53 TaxID=1314785 RepID=A0A165HB65_9APHY|nr:tryptophan synthase beta subunit-like PLP-dependent enzyme [Laetiporus sulphureus 93-53]KZT11494.1 tryptophan synthase beta subunit-like PLP-dependent enzyme [Laetiporus sulphureus 93-53]